MTDFTIAIFAKHGDSEPQIAAMREMSLEGDMSSAIEICQSIAKTERKKLGKNRNTEIRAVIYENRQLADMMFDPRWKTWNVISTAYQPWRTAFPETLADLN